MALGGCRRRHRDGGSTSGTANTAHELRQWAYGGGKVLPGLVARRETEITILFGRPIRDIQSPRRDS
ncbi:MAG: glycoside hydrolase family protein [Acidiferrobacter sp.]